MSPGVATIAALTAHEIPSAPAPFLAVLDIMSH
jgi:hypothetical protein